MTEFHWTVRRKILFSATYLFLPILIWIAFFLIYIFLQRIFVLNVLMPSLIVIGLVIQTLETTNERLIINSEGIEHHTRYYAIKARWKVADKIGVAFRLLVNEQGIYFDQTNINVIWKHPRKKFPQLLLIPLSSFSKNWRESELGQQIKQYAPHLFEKEKSV